jgi:NTP pyrophosphatase (non-canonical NTP hydrolase)
MARKRTFDELEDAVRRFRDERDWRQFHKPKDLAVSIAIETAELLEHFQWKTDAEIDALLADPAQRKAVAEEMADVLILVLSAADVVGIDLHAAALYKIAANARKYPVAKARGTARKYDRL